MKVPYLFLKQQNKELKHKILNKISSVLDSSMFILGSEVEKFEKNFANLIGTKYAVGVNSGTDALLLSLLASDIKNGDEVITVANSFVATANIITLIGAKPIFIDIKNDLLINEHLIEKKITKKTRAIMPVHLTGRPANMEVIMEISKKYNVAVIEDSAQAVLAKWNNKNVGSYGIGAFSLHPLKNLSACGDGGVVTTNDEAMYRNIKLLRNHGLKNRDCLEKIGINSRLDEIQAALLNIKIKKLPDITKKRRKNSEIYCKLFSQKNIKEVKYVPKDNDNTYSVYHTFIIRVENRDDLQKHLKKNGIETKVHYPIPIHQQPPYQAYNEQSLPNTKKYSGEILSLPIHQYLKEKQIKYTVDMIENYFNN